MLYDPPVKFPSAAILARAACGLAALGACSEPRYDRDPEVDGKASNQGPADAGPSDEADTGALDASTPEPQMARLEDDAGPRSPLEGRYVVRARFAGRSTLLGATAQMVNELIQLVEIKSVAGELHMLTTTCRDRGYASTPLGRVNAQMLRPELQPPRDFRIEQSGSTFRAESAPALLGYSEPPPAACTAGASIPRQPAQVWLGGAPCSCPSSDLAPTLPGDCRVDDLDDDGKPGVTIVLSGAVESSDYVRVRESSRYLDGVIDPGGAHHASYEKIEDLYQLQCQGPYCTRTEMTACAAASNPVTFVRLPASAGQSWTCSALLSEINQGRFLRDEPQEFPSGC